MYDKRPRRKRRQRNQRGRRQRGKAGKAQDLAATETYPRPPHGPLRMSYVAARENFRQKPFGESAKLASFLGECGCMESPNEAA